MTYIFYNIRNLIVSYNNGLFDTLIQLMFLLRNLHTLNMQSEQSEKFSKIPDWLEKSRPSKKATFALIM